MTTPDLRAALLADRTIVRAGQEEAPQSAYARLLSESTLATRELNPSERVIFARTLPTIEPKQVADLSLGYASANFKTLDKNGNGALDKEEIAERRALLSKQPLDKELIPGLPAVMEGKLLESLAGRHSYLRNLTKTGSWWNLNLVDPPGITKEDLGAALKETAFIRKLYATPPLIPGLESDKDVSRLPDGVPQLLADAGVEVKTVAQPVSQALAAHLDDAPVIAISQALYNPGTREIFTEQKDRNSKAKLHEIGHAVDDSLVPGPKFFSDSAQYNQAVDQDMKALPKLDFQKIFPRLHVFVQSGLEAGNLNTSARKELFAELYQSGDTELANGLRQYFPRTGSLVDQTLSKQGIGRFVRPENK